MNTNTAGLSNRLSATSSRAVWVCLAAVLLIGAALRLGPWWTGYRRVWSDHYAWLHLYTVDTLRGVGPAGLLRAFYSSELNQPEPSRHPFPPLLPVVTAGVSYLVGVEWAVRLAPVAAWVLGGVLLFRLARQWSLPPQDAVLAVALAGFSIECVRLQGLHFVPQALSGLLAFGLLGSAFALAHAPGPRFRSLIAGLLGTALWTALTVVGYGPNLFHIGGVLVASLAVERLLDHRLRWWPVAAAVALGLAVALPYMLMASFQPGTLADYFVPINGHPRLVKVRDLAKYPVLIGPVILAMAAAAAPRLWAGCRAAQPGLLWLAVWIAILAPQTIVWVFIVPGPPSRLLVLLIPALALAAVLGLRWLLERWRVPEHRHIGIRAALALVAVAMTTGFLARIELPRRRVPEGEVEVYRRACALPAGSVVFGPMNGVWWYHSRRRPDLVFGGLPSPDQFAQLGAGAAGYWIVTERERMRPVYELVERRGRVLFESQGNRLLYLPPSSLNP